MPEFYGKAHAIYRRVRSRRLVLIFLLIILSVGLQVALSHAQSITGGCGYGYGCNIPCGYYYDGGYGYGYQYRNCAGYIGCDAYATCSGAVNSDGYIGCTIQRDGYPSVNGDAYVTCDWVGPYTIWCDAHVDCPSVGCNGYQPPCSGVGCDGYQDCTGVGCDGYTGCLPDLVASSLTAPDSVRADSYFKATTTVFNNGCSGIPDWRPPLNASKFWYDLHFLSADPQLDDSDIFISFTGLLGGPLAVGQSYGGYAKQMYMPVVPDGVYFLLFQVDKPDNVAESNETNNVMARQIVVDGTPPMISDVNIVPQCGGETLIAWKTDEPATSELNWWVPYPTGAQIVQDSIVDETLTTDHVLRVSGVYLPLGIFYFNIVTRDAVGNVIDSYSTLGGASVGSPGASSKPDLSLSRSSVYWGSNFEYLQRLLSVDYRITNNSYIKAMDLQIVGSATSNGVTIAEWPGTIGDITAKQSRLFTMKYNIPPNVAGFQSRLEATAGNSCGASFRYP